MEKVVNAVFDVLAKVFDKIPFINKLKGARSIVGLLGMAVVVGLHANGIGGNELMGALETGFLVFTGLSLNSKGRE